MTEGNGVKETPIFRVRLGLLQCAVWENTRQVDERTTRTYQSVTLKRSYKDKDGNWQETTSLGAEDLPTAIHLLGRAMSHVVQSEYPNK